jgi:ADP-heptose:LPS heptosyltransferase
LDKHLAVAEVDVASLDADQITAMIAKTSTAISIAGLTTGLLGVASITEGAKAVIAPDSLGIYLGAATGVPKLGIWGSHTPYCSRLAPWRLSLKHRQY